MRSKLLVLLIPVFMVGCGSPNTSNPNASPSPSSSAASNIGKAVTFNVKIDKTVFGTKKREIQANLYDSEQLELSKKTANCSVSYDVTTQKETVICPPGVTYNPVKPNPEVFKFNLDEISDTVTIKSTTVKVGENYRLAFSGLSSDNCNTASASLEKKAENETIAITELEWESTQLGCLN